MKGYDVIWSGDLEIFEGRGSKSKALKRAKEIYYSGLDDDVFVQRWDLDNPDGYYANEETIFIKWIIKKTQLI